MRRRGARHQPTVRGRVWAATNRAKHHAEELQSVGASRGSRSCVCGFGGTPGDAELRQGEAFARGERLVLFGRHLHSRPSIPVLKLWDLSCFCNSMLLWF
jgi:hypothetical protein